MVTNYTFAFKFWLVFSFVFLVTDQTFFCPDIIYSYRYSHWAATESCFSPFKSSITFYLFTFLAQYNLLIGIIDIVCSFALMTEAFTKRVHILIIARKKNTLPCT